ncbi:MAG TPA: hypothetical protein VEI07_14565 [Planctomycetaceae bacterium]|nr:hypothetical protein [Planctomycetaceae bacterium]
MIMKNRLPGDVFGGKERRSGRPADGGAVGPAAKYFRSVEETIAEHPGLSLVAAVLAGIVLAWWIKRR